MTQYWATAIMAIASIDSRKGMTMTNNSNKIWEWLENRGLNADMLAEMGFRSGEHNGKPLLKIPFERDGAEYVYKYRSIGEDRRFFSLPKGIEKSLWNIDALRRDPEMPVIITEGELDAVSVMQVGFDRVVSLPDGWSVMSEDIDVVDPSAKLRPIIEVEALLRDAPSIIIANDNDEVGTNFSLLMRRLFEGCDVRRAKWPDGCKDANDVLVHHGADVLNRCIQRAERIDPPGMRIFAPSEMPEREGRRVLRPGPGLSKMIALEVGQISVSTGVPGSGKSTFATFLADRIRGEENCRVGFCLMETPTPRLRTQLSLLVGGKHWASLPDRDRERLDRYYRIVERVDFENADECHDFGWIKTMVHTLAVREQCKLIVLDPWNEIDHLPAPGESLTNYANIALTRLRQWADSYGCHIHLVAHPKKIPEGTMPGGYDIADSAAFANKPALGWSVGYSDSADKNSPTKIQVWKVRDRELYGFGPRYGILDFDPAAMSYSPTDRR